MLKAYWEKNKLLLITKALVAGLLIIFVLWLASLAVENHNLRQIVFNFGYFGVFLASIIGSINLIVPVPTASFVPLFMEAGLDFNLVLIVLIIGTTVGDLVAYFITHWGRRYMVRRDVKIVRHLEMVRLKYKTGPLVVLFLFTGFVPFPNEVLIVPLTLAGFRWQAMLPWLLAGNTIFNLIASYGFIGLFKLIF